MAGVNIASVAIVILMLVFILGGVKFMANDIIKNPNLDTRSIQLLAEMGTEYDDYFNASTAFAVQQSNVTENSTFSGTDAFAREYLEYKTDTTSWIDTIVKILYLPSLMIKIFGVDDSSMLIMFSSAVYGIISLFLGLAAFKALRTGEVD